MFYVTSTVKPRAIMASPVSWIPLCRQCKLTACYAECE